MCDDVMSVARIRCRDCTHLLLVPYSWCPHGGGFLDERAAHRFMLEHAREMPVLHPTLLPGHHAVSRPA